jgi:molybdopterin converting factor small subunit
MRVKVTVMGHSAAYFPGGRRVHELELPGPLSLEQIICQLGADPQLIMRALIDGQAVPLDTVPADGAEIVLISPASGG